ncbi:murein transglycosylase [Vibrio japonicus]|uniref:Murein transglycosylase n=1 Tax=Vibrio japonicus TaxID=1824638 RepID=A0ABY5LH44_9VIBR|nr:murein transglycosylase [Vibrio japonicus]UUM30113.1 murein transglycosylase [Vibrio japonicus]
MLTFSKSLHRIPSSLAVVASMVCSAGYATSSMATNLSHQREVYDQAQEYLDHKQIDKYQEIRGQISDYPLTPYVDYRAFLVDLSQRSPKEVEQFMQSHKDFPFSARISAPYLSSLARTNQWKTLLEFQTTVPKGETYQCHYYTALYKQGNKAEAFKGAELLWQSGGSVSEACDSLFGAWNDAGLRTDEHIIGRMLLSFESRNGSMMGYLAKLLASKEAKQQAIEMKALFDKPETVLEFAQQHPQTSFYQQQTKLALQKLARQNVVLAQSKLTQVATAQKLTASDEQSLADYIAFRLINTNNRALIKWRDSKIATTGNVSLLERRIRLSIQHADWKGVKKWISLLPEEPKQSLRWQYWLGRSELATGKTLEGQQRLEALVGQRNFYSVAAAKEVKRSINYPVTTIQLDKQSIQPFMRSLARIEELVERDKIAAAKSEWRWLLSKVDENQKEMLAAYASYKNWHNLSVTATIEAKMWDNMQLRFPIAHHKWFNFYGEKHSIDPITLMSLARQESALDVEAKSPVGARGIMQIMPSTAKYTARKYEINYSGSNELFEVGKNIEIGSHYLKGLLEQYDNNRIFALAAYNAGPHRVKTWRNRTQGQLDAYSFIEAIPFNETRGYVQNILMFETYYRDLMGVDGAFLNQHEINTRY